jgi:hypothetical protein
MADISKFATDRRYILIFKIKDINSILNFGEYDLNDLKGDISQLLSMGEITQDFLTSFLHHSDHGAPSIDQINSPGIFIYELIQQSGINLARSRKIQMKTWIKNPGGDSHRAKSGQSRAWSAQFLNSEDWESREDAISFWEENVLPNWRELDGYILWDPKDKKINFQSVHHALKNLNYIPDEVKDHPRDILLKIKEGFKDGILLLMPDGVVKIDEDEVSFRRDSLRHIPFSLDSNQEKQRTDRLSNYIKSPQTTRMTSMFQKLGYKGLIDPGKSIIHELEPSQAVFWNTGNLEIIDLIDRFKDTNVITKGE